MWQIIGDKLKSNFNVTQMTISESFQLNRCQKSCFYFYIALLFCYGSQK